ncbi:hypothetical protein [Alteribacillus bidgolensis]|uniref:Stage II sporulation protein B n=1 Tax=Alteribacillus bidgolensis TaxID=930129 RepID=A0A1G8MSY6_9BACI|nr:hypothetical protein [Alteribacillus bidgolensis]SDI70420.1 hypothetical protein SAMN05216352_110155 [Alteribacillus bidgolensis]
MKKDKPEVSFKINGKKIDLEKEEPKQSEPPEQSDQNLDNIPVADWKEKRAAEEEQAASFWEEDKPKRPSVPYKKIRKKANLPRKPKKPRNYRKSYSFYFITLTVGAVALGLLFGIVMLQLFSKDDASTTAAINRDDQAPPISANFNDSTTMQVIQTGAFTKKEKGLEMQGNFHANGYPAVLTHDGEYYYLFSGVSFNEEGTERLKEYYNSEGLEMYEKTRTMPEPEENEQNDTENTEMLLTSKQLLMNMTNAALLEEKEKSEELLGTLENHLEQTENWKEDKVFADLRNTLEEIKKEWAKNKQTSSTLQELLIEAVLYYEEAVYAHNGEDREEGNSETKQEPQ